MLIIKIQVLNIIIFQKKLGLSKKRLNKIIL